MRSIGDDELRSMDAVFCGDTPHPDARRPPRVAQQIMGLTDMAWVAVLCWLVGDPVSLAP